MNDSELDRILRSAQTIVTPQAGFQREVWLRIEAAETMRREPLVKRFAERVFNWLALPPVAFATCALMLAAGILTGLESGNPSPQGEAAYIQSVSPFARTHHP